VVVVVALRRLVATREALAKLVASRKIALELVLSGVRFLIFSKSIFKSFRKIQKKNIWMLSATYTMSVQNLNAKYLVV
jgi:hypothetical protein